MRIAFITFEYPPSIIGGAGVYALNVTRELANLGHEVVVFTPDAFDNVADEVDSIDNLKFNKIKLHEMLPFRALQFWLRLPKEVKKADSKKKFDIIHFNGISYWFLKKKILNIPHIMTVHHLVKSAIKSNDLGMVSRIKNMSGENNIYITSIEKRCIKSADKLIAVSDFTKNETLSTYNINPEKIEVIHNGINLDGYNFSNEEVEDSKKQLNISNKKILLFVGRINDPRKGLKFILNSLVNVVKNHDVVLLIVGKGDQSEIRYLAESLGISKNVVFTGFVDEIQLKKYYALCDIYVCPSKLEGFGLTLVEAMAAGKPIVATNVGAIPEIICSKNNGFLVETDDIIAMSNAIHTLLSDENLLNCIGLRNKQYVKKFDWKNHARKTIEIYCG